MRNSVTHSAACSMAKRILQPKISTPVQFPASYSLRGRQSLLHTGRKELVALQERSQRSSCHHLPKQTAFNLGGNLPYQQRVHVALHPLNISLPQQILSDRVGQDNMLMFINEEEEKPAVIWQ